MYKKQHNYLIKKEQFYIDINTRYSNGYTEGINNKIKVMKRIAFGYKNFKLFRGRILYVFDGKISGSIKKKK